MNILILEDEQAAARRLTTLLKELQPDANILAIIETVKEGISWLKGHPSPDIILSDIQLADGISFDIFSEAAINSPIIFTTAYDLYMLKAFKVNSIDYLLKPIDKQELEAAFNKYNALRKSDPISDKLANLFQQLQTKENSYKSRFLVKRGEQYIYIPAEEVAWVKADDKVVCLFTSTGKKYFIDDTLEELDGTLDPHHFFRINRSYIAHIRSIQKIHMHFNGRLKIELALCDDNDIFVSRQRVTEFKKWLDK
jgi:DNA-binding LytR/AlgR family response regulator